MCWMQRGHVVPGASHPLQSSFCLGETLSKTQGDLGLTSEEGNTTCPFQRLLSKRWSITQVYFLYFQMGAVAIFELSPVYTGHIQSIPVGFFSHRQFAWTDNSVDAPMWI